MEAVDTQHEGTDGQAPAEPPSTLHGVIRLHMPAPDADSLDAASVDRALTQFFRTGTVPPDFQPGSVPGGLVPALVRPFLRRRSIRTPWPVVMIRSDNGTRVTPLSSYVDDLSQAIGGDGDEGELRRRFLVRIEEEIRAAPTFDEIDFEEAWFAGVDHVRPGIREDRRDVFEDAVRAAAAHVPSSARLVPCAALAPVAVATTMAGELLEERSRPVVDEAERLERILSSMLDVEREESHEAVEPDRLRDAIGGAYADAFDFEALSHLLDEAPHAAGLSPDRRTRLESLVDRLRDHVEALFGSPDTLLRPLSHRAAGEAATDRLERLLSFFRDLEAARLEERHRYVPDVHDAYLDSFSTAMLSDEDLHRCPPLLVTADESSLDAAGVGHLVDLLAGPVPVKVLLTLRRSPEEPESEHHASMLPDLAVGGGTAYVVQTTLSDAATLVDGIREAIRFKGPALVAVFAGDEHSGLPPYFDTALARDGRAVPSMRFSPDPGRPWVERMTVDGNEQVESDWPSATLEYYAAGGETSVLEVAFTWLDYAVTRPALGSFFLALGDRCDSDRLVPAHEYMALAGPDRSDRIPFVWCATEDGAMHRVVASRPMVDAADRALDRWRRRRELAGINNSFVNRAVAEIREELELERDRAVDEARQAYDAELERTVGSVAENIVANIAASLLDLPATGAATPARVAAPAAPTAVPTPDEEVAAEAPTEGAAPAEDEDEEAALSLDEAWIETVRCTTCNECTNLNGMMFAYNDEKQAYIKDASAGPYRDLVQAAEKCPVRIIHPGKPLNPDEPGLEDLIERAKPFL